MSVQRILARLRPYSCFRSRQNTEVEFPMQLAVSTSQLVDPRNNSSESTCKCVLVTTAIKCVIRLLAGSMRHVLEVELGAKTSHIFSSPSNSFAPNRALIPSFLRSACRSSRSFQNKIDIHSLERFRTLRVGQVLSVWPSSSHSAPLT